MGFGELLQTMQEKYIEKAKAIHGDRYDYSKVVYTTNDQKIIIICPIHGEFVQLAASHAPVGKGCKQCATNVIKNKLKYTFEEFVRTAEFVHGKDHYEYPIQELDSRIKIKIYCKIHDLWFEQRMNAHLRGDGCGKCGQLKRVASRKQVSKGGS